MIPRFVSILGPVRLKYAMVYGSKELTQTKCQCWCKSLRLLLALPMVLEGHSTNRWYLSCLYSETLHVLLQNP
jgi:hypothetical protein